MKKNPSVIPLVISNLKCVQIGFYLPKFLKFPKIYFYFCVIIIFGDPFDATPIVQGPMGQFILLCSYSESRVIIRDGIMARAMNGAFSLAIDKYNSEDERRSFIC